MATRYVSITEKPEIARGLWWADAKESLARTVYEAEPANAFTGLLDASGVKIFRVEEKEPIGFIRREVVR